MNGMKIGLMLALVGCSGAAESSETEFVSALTQNFPLQTCDYPQMFGNGQHTGNTCAQGPRGLHVVAKITQDADADQEAADFGFFAEHVTAPLSSGDWLVVGTKSGYTSPFDRTTESYGIDGWHWVCAPGQVAPCVNKVGSTLTKAWSHKATWRSSDQVNGSIGTYTNGYEHGFFPAIVGESVYAPALSGKVERINLATGAVVATIDPLAGTAFDGDAHTLTVSGISADVLGHVFYNITAFPLSGFYGNQPRESFAVKVNPNNTFVTRAWSAIATPAVGIPQLSDLCTRPFSVFGRSPTGPNDHSNQAACGTPRPAFNAPPAVLASGNLLVASINNQEWSSQWLIELDASTLAPIRASDTRGHMFYGCGGRLSITSPECALITANGTVNLGFDPDLNSPVGFQGSDIMDGAPFQLPNGDYGYSGYDGGFSFSGDYDAQGAVQLFDGTTHAFKALNSDFGWEVTPSVIKTGSTFSMLQDRNIYDQFDLGVAQFSSVFSLQNDGVVAPDPAASAVDFLDAHIMSDADGRRYGVNGDGHLYVFDSSGHQVDSVELTNDDGSVRSLETLSGYGARDRAGRIIVSYAGSVYVIEGATTGSGTIHALAAPTAAQRAAMTARRQRAAEPKAPPLAH